MVGRYLVTLISVKDLIEWRIVCFLTLSYLMCRLVHPGILFRPHVLHRYHFLHYNG